MNKIKLIVFFSLLPFFAVAQGEAKNDQEAEQKEKTKVKISGFIRYESFFDSHKSVTAREGDLYLYPMNESLDANGINVNKINQLEMLALQSRVNMAISGPEAFGAKTSGVLEIDFFGTAENLVRTPRMRHAFFKLNWTKSELLMGQYWHPMFNTSIFPGTLSFGAAVPFHPLNRSPQVRYTYKPIKNLSIVTALLMHGYHASSGPATAQRDAGLPDSQLQLVYTTGKFLVGATVGYKFLRPRTETHLLDVATKETVGSYNVQGFIKFANDDFTAKIQGLMGENLSHLVMLGGYGAAQNPLITDDYSYINLKTMSVWTDLQTNGKKYQFGLFAGYSENLGAENAYYSLGYARGEDIKYIYRISPRAMVNSGKMQFGLEYLFNGAAYDADGVLGANGEINPAANNVINHRILFSAAYMF